MQAAVAQSTPVPEDDSSALRRLRSLELLAGAGAILHRSLDYRNTLRDAAALVVPTVADWCAIDILDDAGRYELVACAHVNPERVRYGHELRERYPVDPNAPEGMPQVVRSQQPQLVPVITDEMLVAGLGHDPELLRIFRELGLTSALTLPLVARGRSIGALSLFMAESGRHFEGRDLELAEDFARRVAVACDNARLFEAARRAEKEARTSEARLRIALEAGRMGDWAFDLRSGKVQWSPAIERMHGLEPGAFDGTFEGWKRDIHPDDFERVLASVQASSSGEAEHRLSYRIVRPDGAVRHLEASGVLVRDDEGRPERMLGVCSDVTERHDAAEATRRIERERRAARNARLRAEVASAFTGRGDLRRLASDCCEVLGRTLDLAAVSLWMNEADEPLELRGSWQGPGVHAPQIPRGDPFLAELAAAPHGWQCAHPAEDPRVAPWQVPAAAALGALPLRLDDKRSGLLVLKSRRPLEDDLFALLSIVAEAITQGLERARAEDALARHAEELRRSNEELQQFAYVASHDLQEPLRMVASYVQLLERRYRGRLDEDADEFIGFAVEGVVRMQALIQDLLHYSRVGTRGREFVPVAVDAALGDALANLSVSIAQQGAEVVRGPLPTVRGDRQQLAQLFQNLVGNALKFRGDAPPRVELSAERTGAEWTLRVKDNGIGIAPEFHERVFVIFQRLHTRAEYPGNGIGLAICRKIVERHGGRIWIESRPGEGTTFALTLPATDA